MLPSSNSSIQGVELLEKDAVYTGGFADVYRGSYRGEEVALKRLRIFHHQKDQERRRARRRLSREANVWQQLKHPYVSPFLGIDDETFFPSPCMVSPWMRHRTILDLRKAAGPSNINIERRILEVAQGVEYLHSQGVIHGDLRGENILIDDEWHACLADFGLSVITDTMGFTTVSDMRSTRWMAPELIHPQSFGLDRFQRTFHTDIYAFSCFCLETYTGRPPFASAAQDSSAILQVLEGSRPARPDFDDEVGVVMSDDMWCVVEACWRQNPAERFSITDVVRLMQSWNSGWPVTIRQNVKSTVAQWIFDNGGCHLLWLENSSAERTSYIAQSMAELCAREGRIAASIFFLHGRPDTLSFYPKIANQLTRSIPAAKPLIRKAINDDPSILSPGTFNQLQDSIRKLIVDPLISLSEFSLSNMVIVVDDLGLCDNDSDHGSSWLTREMLIQTIVSLTEALHKYRLPLQVFVASQPELHRQAKYKIPNFRNEARSLYLHKGGLLDSQLDGWEELRRLNAEGATYDSPNRHFMQDYIPDSHEDVVVKISEWIDNNRGHPVCWLKYPNRRHGQPSAIAQRIAEDCARKRILAASIFCSSRTVNSVNFLPTLAYQLAQSIPSLKSSMHQTIEDKREILLSLHDHPEDAAHKLIIEPFLTGKVPSLSPMVVVIDCVGWCEGYCLLRSIMWFAEALRKHTLPLQIFMTTEPEIYRQANLNFPDFLDRTHVLRIPRFEPWSKLTSPDHAPTKIFVDRAQKVYQNLVSFLMLRISNDHSTNQRLRGNLQAYIDRMAALDRVANLVQSQQCRRQLLQMATEMQISEHPGIREALQKDEIGVAVLFEGVLESDTDKKAVLALKEDDAHSLLNLIQMVLDKGQLCNQDLNRRARRLLVRLSEASEIIPLSVSIQGFTLLEKDPVAGGAFADIHRALYQGKVVALKHLRARKDQDPQKIRRAFGREALVWQQLRHAYVLPFLGIDSETFSSSLCMVSPWMQHGTILDLRLANGPLNINIEKRLLEVAEGLDYLHSEGVIHGDLRGGNILIDDQWHARLADFGLTVFGDASAATQSNHPGSVRWMAPELHYPEMFGMERVLKTRNSDVYAFGCVCLEIYTGQHPFLDAANDAAVTYRVTQGMRPTRVVDCDACVIMSDGMWNVVEICWQQKPSDRPPISIVLQMMKDLSPGSLG